jgi:hypothetical protein
MNFRVGLWKTDGPCLIHYRDVFHSEVAAIQFSATPFVWFKHPSDLL